MKTRIALSACALALSALWVTGIGAQTTTTQSGGDVGSGVKTINNPAGGHIYLGGLAGQPTPQQALGKTLHRVSVYCGDHPQLGRLVQSPSGELLAAFFTVTGKNQDGKPMAGLALAYAPKNGSAGGAVLMDNADRFPSTVNSMFATLKQALAAAPSGASGAPASGKSAPAAPPETLQPAVFQDGTGVIGLPAGWQVQSAHMGDVNATGPHGEKLRFGMTIPVAGNNGRATGSFIAIPYGTAPDQAYKSAVTQLSRKGGRQAPDITVANVQEIPMQGGKNYFLYGNFDAHDGGGQRYFVAQMINTPPLVMGAWQMTLFQISGPPQVMADESATIAAIFPSYNRNSRLVNTIANQQIADGIRRTNQFVSTVGHYIDDSNRMGQGMSDYLREQSVILDTETGGHARTSDQLADALIDANPSRFQRVPLSDYISGIDY